jgi:hypothetical protein
MLRTVVLPFIYSRGIDFTEMTVALMIAFGAQILLFFVLNKNLSSRLSWYFAMICLLASILLVVDVRSAGQYYLSAVFNGFNLFLFFIFYNIAHFEATPKERTGISSGIMFAIPPSIGIIAPLFAGFIGQINIWFAWIFSFATLGTAFLMIRFQNNFHITYTLKDSLREISKTRAFIFVEGLWEALIFAFIPIYTLFFIKDSLGYGIFLSYLSILSAVATLLIGRISDKFQKRIIFLYPVTIIMGFSTFLFPLALNDLFIWAILAGIIAFLTPIFWNVSTAMVIDSTPNLRTGIPGREFVLALGRLIGIGFVLISFLMENKPFFVFFFLGFVILLYPLILFYRTRISKKYSYL